MNTTTQNVGGGYKFTRVLNWCVINTAFVLLMWLALVQHDKGAGNVIQLVVWVCVFGSLFGVFNEQSRLKLIAKGRTVPGWLSLLVTLPMVMSFVYCGWWVTGLLMLLDVTAIGMAHDLVNNPLKVVAEGETPIADALLKKTMHDANSIRASAFYKLAKEQEILIRQLQTPPSDAS